MKANNNNLTILDASISNQYEGLIHVNKLDLNVYNNDELAEKLKVSKRTLQNWRDNGLISFTQIGGKIFYTYEDIEQFLKSHKITAFTTK